MPSRASKRTVLNEIEATNSLAARIVAQTTGEQAQPAKNPFAVALGKLGASKGGKARAAALSDRRKAQIAKKAAAARWSKK
jgi:hypothetical protein